jgi:hypothetical protein
MKTLLACVLMTVACGGAAPKVTQPVRVSDARLLALNPDVKVVADADQPIFFARGSYWLFNDGKWWRAPSPGHTWEYEAEPPVPVRQIDQPFAFVHYKKDQPGKEIETVARRPDARPGQAEPTERPARERPASAVDPSIDPTINMFPAR